MGTLTSPSFDGV